jgi:hypothetical protein
MERAENVGRRSTRDRVKSDLVVTCCECGYTRHVGQAPVTASSTAAKHALTRHHKTLILTVTHVIDPMANQVALFGDDEPPF